MAAKNDTRTEEQRAIDARIAEINKGLCWRSESLELVRLSCVIGDLSAIPGVVDGVYIMNIITKTLVGLDRMELMAEYPRRRVPPKAHPLIGQGCASAPAWHYPALHGQDGIIWRVCQSTDQAIRLCYGLYQDDALPTIMASASDHDAPFDDLEPGVGYNVHAPYGRDKKGYGSLTIQLTVHSYCSCRDCHPAFMRGRWAPDSNDGTDRHDCRDKVCKYIRQQVQVLQAAQKGELQLLWFLCDWKARTLTYADTVIRIPDADSFTAAANMLVDTPVCNLGDYYEFIKVVTSIIRHVQTPVLINGTSVCYTTKVTTGGARLPYVNGCKVATTDVEHVLRTAVCYPNRQTEYDDFVRTVSKVSLKFHRAVAEGLLVKFDYACVPDELREELLNAGKNDNEAGTKLRIPGSRGGGADDGGYKSVAVKVPVRKSAGKRAEVRLFGRWRKVGNLEKLIQVVKSTNYSPHYYRAREQMRMSLAAVSVKDVPPDVAPAPTNGTEEPAVEAPGYAMDAKTGILRLIVPAAIDEVQPAPDKPPAEPTCKFTSHDEYMISRLAQLDCALLSGSKIISEGLTIFVRDVYGRTNGRSLLRCNQTRALLTDVQRQLARDSAGDSAKFHERLAKSRKLLEVIMQETGATEVQRDGKFVYRVTGESGAVYEIDEESAAVSHNGQHICIVPASKTVGSDHVGYDYIASLVSALAHDRRTARDISTLKCIVADTEAPA